MSRERKRKTVSDDFIAGEEDFEDSEGGSEADDVDVEAVDEGDDGDVLSDGSEGGAKSSKKDKKSSKKKDKKGKKDKRSKSGSKSKSSKKSEVTAPTESGLDAAGKPSKKIRFAIKKGTATSGAAVVQGEEEAAGEEVTSRGLSFKKIRQVPKRRMWKNLKQILKHERYHLVPATLPTYENIAAPPSLLPAKKYCDITGLPAPYTHPRTKIRFANKDVYQTVSGMSDERVQQYLAPRGVTYHTRSAV